MDIKQLKQSAREEFQERWLKWADAPLIHKEDIALFLNSIIDRTAEATKEAIVPEEKENPYGVFHPHFEIGENETDIYNSCRAKTLQNWDKFKGLSDNTHES